MGARRKTSSYSDQIGPNEIKMPINPVLIAVARSRKVKKKTKTLKYAHANAKTGPAVPSRIQTAKC